MPNLKIIFKLFEQEVLFKNTVNLLFTNIFCLTERNSIAYSNNQLIWKISKVNIFFFFGKKLQLYSNNRLKKIKTNIIQLIKNNYVLDSFVTMYIARTRVQDFTRVFVNIFYHTIYCIMCVGINKKYIKINYVWLFV